MLKIYNTLSRKKEAFKPIKKGEAGMYACGPTAYWYQHIGNLRTYIFSDILRRTLEYNGFKVKQVMNVTDVGHLTSDADEGEDKIEKAALKEGKSAKQIVDYYLGIFREDLAKLNISEPGIWCKASEHIKEQIELVKILEKKGFAYKTSDGIYFDTSKFRDYTKFARLKKEGLEAGKRISLKEKKNITDFALWKFSEEPGKRQQEWPSPFGGIGFPGWHIECSAMSMKYLGEHFDIHTGGIDHIPVHHTNEIAQSEAATGKKFVNYWLHGAFLVFKGEKISKSTGGLFTIAELQEQGFLPLAYRYLALTSHYRNPLEFSLEGLEGAQNSYKRLKNIIAELHDDGKTNKAYLKKFESAINNDLDMPKALSVLWGLLRDEKAEGKIATIKEMDRIFGLDLLKKEEISVPEEVKKLAEEREKARTEKNWGLADEIRKKIIDKGYAIDDTPEGTKIKKQ
ncbi:MAG: cysteine--tRNA ligase [Candidatus ainarchaeum sp.]|nr:cysteine--tRNA ligase [Candidatus ainarchaeum sp.]